MKETIETCKDLTSQMSQKYTVLQRCSCGEEALGQDPLG